MNRRVYFSSAVGLVVLLLAGSSRAETPNPSASKAEVPKYLVKPLANPPGDPSLPNVLLIGDSISIGYTIPVRKVLLGKANVYRPSTNCRYSSYGAANVASWLAKRKWDVIHFNFGIWDTHMMREGRLVRHAREGEYPAGELSIRCPEREYVDNLKKIVAALEATGAKVIWASTTPVAGRTEARKKDIPRYNQAAAKLMGERGVEIDDLFGFVLPNLGAWQLADGCHYNPTGCEQLGKQVARCIEKALVDRAKGRQ